MVFFIQIIQFLAGLSIIVGIHELGHLLFAKLFKIRVNSYMIGFPPIILKAKYGETEYRLGSIPLGGAVQIAGMVDESLDTNHASTLLQPWEFRSKPTWQRLIVILGGIIFNLISAMLLYIGLTYAMGHTYLPNSEVNKQGIIPNAIGMQIGFQEGDKVIKINGKYFDDFYEIFSPGLLLSGKGYYTITREQKELDLPIPDHIIECLTDKKNAIFLQPLYPCIIQAVLPNSPANLAGLQAGDQIIALAGQPTAHMDQLRKVMQSCLSQAVEMVYLRNGAKMNTFITFGPNDQKLGIQTKPLEYKTIKYSFIKSIPMGFKHGMTAIQNQILGIWKLITGKFSIQKSLGGPISIAQMFGHAFIWSHFLMLIASLSIVIGLTNLLPLPILDGGHALFIIYEMVSGRKPSYKFLQITQQLGMILFLLIMLYVFCNDIYKLIK